jgi:hypothetical protein
MLQFSDKARLRRIKEIARRGRRLGKIERRNAVGRVAEILKTGEPTLFRYEADCRHKLRARMCLDGISWARADATAAEIVAEALALIGARRPSWNEGQPQWTDSGANSFLHTRCARCGKPLPPQEAGFAHGRPRQHCSRSCAVGAFNDKNIDDVRAYNRAYRRALKAAAPDSTCETCEGTFKSVKRPGRPAARFCSNACYHRGRTKNKQPDMLSVSSHPGPDRGVHCGGYGE